jgi:two-component system sensor histidine kinase RegB
MGAQGADPLGEAPRRTEFAELMSRVRERFPEDSGRIRLEIDDAHSTSCVIPFRAAVEAISALVKNAVDASNATDPVILKAWADEQRVHFVVRDNGDGMTPDILERVCEPFFTTKPTGKGMGLGAFLAHLFAVQLGGELTFQSEPGRGCTAILELPRTIHARS